jgi:phage terminase Nu1 subunit (DNA packaging protein)
METPRKRKSRETPRAIPLAKATEQRARLASAQADLAELRTAEKRGELLDAAEVERAWGGVLRTVRASMLAVPSRIGARLPHLTAADIDEIDREVRDALGEVAADGV